MRLMHLKVSSSGQSDVGLVRPNNEDVWAILEEENFFILADGMGGHKAGEIAAKETVQLICQEMKNFLSKEEVTLKRCEEFFAQAIYQANAAVFKMGKTNPELKGMGTTLCCLLLQKEGAVVAHVGDSRIYRCRKGKLSQVTKDHSLLVDLLELGQISPRSATDFLYKNIITKAVGTEPAVEPAIQTVDIQGGDLFLLCSDGLSDMLSLTEIETLINQNPKVDFCVKALIDAVVQKGAHDNVTIVLVKVMETHETADLSR